MSELLSTSPQRGSDLFTQEVKSSLQDRVSDDVFKYVLIPYLSTLHNIFDIHIGHTTVYEIYKGKYYKELEQPGKEEIPSYETCWTTMLKSHFANERRIKEDQIYERYNYNIGKEITIKLKPEFLKDRRLSDGSWVTKDTLNILSKDIYLKDLSPFYSSFRLIDDTGAIYLFKSHFYGWTCFLDTVRNQQSFDLLRTTSFELQFVCNVRQESHPSTLVVLDQIQIDPS
jgi:hypothetical protein